MTDSGAISESERALPPEYIDAEWQAVFPTDQQRKRVGLMFMLANGEKLRVAVTPTVAQFMAVGILNDLLPRRR